MTLTTALITNPGDLDDLGAELAAAPAIGLDTEFMRERTYRAELCLLQTATPSRATCVDPLALGARRSGAASGTALATEYEPVDFSRTFTISQVIDKDRIEAKLDAGVLRLHLPKQSAQTPRKIPVRVG